MLKKQSKNELFIELAQPNEKGVSKVVTIEQFTGKYTKLNHGNGRSWGRTDDSKFLYELHLQKKSNKITSYKCIGFKKTFSKKINNDIRSYFKNKNCAVLGISKIEIDHKNGRNNDPRVADTLTQKKSDFQLLSRSPNLAKREYCKKCEKSNIRFDAKKIGYKISYIFGGKYHDGSINGCIGCYWFDILEFKKKL